MKKKKYILITILLYILLYIPPAFGQTEVYPVSVITQVTPPYSVNLPDYTAPGSEQLKVIIVQRDLTQAPYSLYLKMEIELNGRTIIRTSSDYVPHAFILEPGIPTLISGSSLSPFFDPANMEFTGYSRDQYIRTKSLPEGSYVITFTAYDWTRRNIALSRGGAFFCYLAKSEPPLLNLPLNNAQVPNTAPQLINFQWLSRTTSSPNSAFSTRYRFELFEIRVGGITPSEIVTNTRPVFTAETDLTSIVYSIAEPPLETGIRYVWRVKAFDTQGRDYIRNNGYSEVFSFVYGVAEGENFDFNSQAGFTARALSPRKALLNWDISSLYDIYKFFYRKQGSSNRWYEIESTKASTEINGLSPGNIYECKVQGKKGKTWSSFSETDTVSMPMIPVIECGSPFTPLNVTSREPLLELMRLQEFDAGGFMVTLADPYAITTKPGRFSGKGFVQVPLFGHKKIRCEFKDIFINTDYQMVEGIVRLIADNTEGDDNALWDVDEVFEGGADNGSVTEGTDEAAVVIPDIVISGPEILILDTSRHEIIVITGPDDTISIDVTEKLKDNPESITVKDSDGNLYSIETKTGKSTYLGQAAPKESSQQSTALPQIIDDRKGIVHFKPAEDSRYAFDKKDSKYQRSNLFNEEYRTIKLYDGSDYEVPFKLIPAGETDKVIATLEKKGKSVVADSIVFRSGTGTVYKAQPSGKNEYLLTLPSGKAGDGIDVFATYTDSKGKVSVLGKMIVMSYSFRRPSLTLVPVNGNGADIDVSAVKKELDEVYLPVAVDWQVTIDKSGFEATADSLDINGSGLFSMYTPGMKKLNSEFILHKGESFDPSTVYLFLLSKSEDGNATGDMPRGKQFGYVFTATAGREGLNRTIAHEIAHGAFSLSHTFDNKYQIPEKSTSNLLDYTAGTDLVKHQWDAIHDPGLVVGMFERDEEGMSKYCFAPKPSKLGTYEGQREVVKAYITTSVGLSTIQQECTETYYYHIEDKAYYSCCDENGNKVLVQPEYKTDWYTEAQYCMKVVKQVLESFAILNGQVRVLNPESRKIIASSNLEQFFTDRTVDENFINLFETQFYNQICNDASIRYSGSGTIERVNFEFDVVLSLTAIGEINSLFRYLKAKRFLSGTRLFASRTGSTVEILSKEAGEKVAVFSDDLLKEIKFIDEGGEVIGTFDKVKFIDKDGSQIEDVIQIIRKDGQIGLRKTYSIKSFTTEQIDEYVKIATKQDHKRKVMLGKFDNSASTGYISRAGNDYTYFDMNNVWDEAEAIVNRNADEMWKINQKFIDNQRELGKEFYLSHDPHFATGYYLREINYLTSPKDLGGLGGKIISQGTNLWKVIW